MEIFTLGIDLGKTVCSVADLDRTGKVVFRKRVRRSGLVRLLVNTPRCVVGMEACCGAHHVGRQAAAYGHEVGLMPPKYVQAYVKAQKNDDRDAEAIVEAANRAAVDRGRALVPDPRPRAHPVPVRTHPETAAEPPAGVNRAASES